MKRAMWMIAGVALVILSLGMSAMAQVTKPASTPPVSDQELATGGSEVTLKGVMMLEAACNMKADDGIKDTVVLFALEGTPRG